MVDVLAHAAAGSAAVLAALFLFASVTKVREFGVFRERLADFDLVPSTLVSAFAWAIVVLELITGALVVARPTVGGWVAAALLLIFATVVAVSWLRGKRHLSCACFGQSRDAPIGWHVVARDLGLALLAFPAVRLDFPLNATEALAGSVLVALYLLLVQVLAETIRTAETLRAQQSVLIPPQATEAER